MHYYPPKLRLLESMAFYLQADRCRCSNGESVIAVSAADIARELKDRTADGTEKSGASHGKRAKRKTRSEKTVRQCNTIEIYYV